MISKRQLELDLLRLEGLHARAMQDPDPRLPLIYSKMAVLELCGWVEESLDDIARRAFKGRIQRPALEKKAKEIIKTTYGFDYDHHITTMLTRLVGFATFETLELDLTSDGSLAVLTAELSAIKVQRDKAAHVSLGMGAVAFDAPSVVTQRMKLLFPILKRMYSWAVHL